MSPVRKSSPEPPDPVHNEFMLVAAKAVRAALKVGKNKQREPFGAVIVKNGVVVATGVNEAFVRRDATATSEITAIRLACEKLETHVLTGCDIYCTAAPDIMSFGAILWARIDRVFYSTSQIQASACGFEEAALHFAEFESRASRGNVTLNVAKPECEEVFRRWQKLAGQIY